MQQISVELENSRNDLEEAQYDKYIQDTSALLDTLYLEYENILNQRLDNVDYLLEQVVAGINASSTLSEEQSNALLASLGSEGTLASALGVEGAIASSIVNAVGENGSIKNILNKEVTAVGTTLSTAMSNIWSVGDGNIKSVLSTYGQGFQSNQTTTNATLNSIKTSVDRMVDDVDKDAQKKTTANKTTTSAKTNTTNTSNANKNTSTTNNNNSSNESKVTDDVIKGVAAAIWVYGKNSGWGNNPFRENKLSDKLGASNAKKVQDYINKHGANGDLYNFWIQKGKNLDKYKYNAFKLGAKDIDMTQLAWTQEGNAQEFIVRPSDGAILTPIAKGDSVLNAAASRNIWDMANSPTEFIKNNLGLDGSNIPNNSSINNSYSQTIENVIFKMDNVKNYDELLTQMQRDKSFEKLIMSMSVDRLAGKSSLAKNKSIR